MSNKDHLHRGHHEKHPLAHLLVYGFSTVAISSGLLVALLLHKLVGNSLLSSAGFGLVLTKFLSIAGGIKGVNRAVGDGKLSLQGSLLADLSKPKPSGTVRVVVISDTHNINPVSLPGGDVLVHCGDFTLKGSSREVHEFCDWLESQPHAKKVVIAGNHDMGLEFRSSEESQAAHARLNGACTLLENNGATIAGLKFWGSPQTPYINKKRRMGFQDSSENLIPFWDKIPQGVDILVTHGPPKGYGDRILLGMNVGCPELMKKIAEVKPRYHVFGHIHEGYGTYPTSDCLFVNAATCNILYNAIHPPIVLDVPLRPVAE